MPINEPGAPNAQIKPPFQSGQPLVEFWDTSEPNSEWKPFTVGRMYCDRLNLRAFNQGMSEATLRYETGEISFESGPFAFITPLDLDRKWIRISFTTDDNPPIEINWAGIVVRTEESNRANPTGAIQTMTQTFRVVGMEWLFSRRQIVTSEIPFANQINYGLTFNTHSEAKIGRATVKGNKSKTWFSFAESDADAEVWTGEDIVDYLKETQFPLGELGEWGWAVENLSYLKWIKAVVQCHGRSLFDVLRALVSPRRGLDSHLYYTPGGNPLDFGTFTYRIDSMFTQNAKLPSGASIPAGDVVDLVTIEEHRGAFTAVHKDSSERFEKVVAVGARTGVVANWSKKDGSFVNGWKTADQTAYRAGDPNAAAILDESVFRDAHDRFRRQKYPQVFTEFIVPLRWDGRVGDGEGKNKTLAFPGQDVYVAGMLFASYIPLKVGWDYQSVQPEPTLQAPDIDELRKPFVLFKIAEDKWEYGHELSNVWDETIDPNGIDFACYTRPLDRRLGMSVDPPVPHLIAAGVANAIDDGTSDREPSLDFEDMIVTAYTQSYSFATGEYPKGESVAEHTHYLRLGDTAFLDYLPIGTVVDVLGGQLVRATRSMYVRDDRKYLEDVARIAWQWYGFNRTASQISYRQITAGAQRGQVVGILDDIQANALVSSVEWDFREQVTEIYTHFAEPDFAEMAER